MDYKNLIPETIGKKNFFVDIDLTPIPNGMTVEDHAVNISARLQEMGVMLASDFFNAMKIAMKLNEIKGQKLKLKIVALSVKDGADIRKITEQKFFLAQNTQEKKTKKYQLA